MSLVRPIARKMFRPLRPLAVAAVLTPEASSAQFTGETAFEKDGVRWLIRPSAIISTPTAGVVRIELTDISSRIDRAAGMVVDGRRYDHTSFGGAIASDLDALAVTSLDVRFEFTGAQGCVNYIGRAAWRPGQANTLSCNSTSAPSFGTYRISGVGTSGVLELRSKIRGLRNTAADEAKKDSIAQANANRPQPAGPAGAAAGAGAPTGSGAASGSASGTPASGTSPSNSDADASAAEAQRNRDEAAQIWAQVLQDQAATEARMQGITYAVDGVTDVVIDVMNTMRRNAEARERARERERVRQDAYRTRINTVFRRLSARPACGLKPEAPIQVGQQLSGRMDGSECRISNQTSADQYTLVVPKRTKVAVVMTSRFWPMLAIQNLASGQVVLRTAQPDWRRADEGVPVMPRGHATLETWLEPGTYNIFALTELPGELGEYDIAVQPGRRSWAGGRLQLATGADLYSADFAGAARSFSGTSLGIRLATAGKQEAVGPEYFSWMLDMSVANTLLTAEGGARFTLFRKRTPWRPYVQYTYGYVGVGNDLDIFDPDYFWASGTAGTLGLGLEWFITPEYALDATYLRTSGTLDEGPTTMSRLRIGVAFHGQPLRPLPLRSSARTAAASERTGMLGRERQDR